MTERSIFLEALEIADPRERASYLDRACAGDAGLRRGVEELLAAGGRTGSFLEGPAVERTVLADAPPERPGAQVGPYKLLQQIGEGGMGVVFMAQQEEPVRRTVALKIIRQGMDSRSVLARFEAERQALAMMDHPNIARVLDAGTTDSGSPFFVMELVKGVPITRFCEDQKLGLRERLALFIPVCQAIQHAHQKGVIHRDIKPSNVLVAMYDDHPVPKVIDFGVAKATGPKLTDKTLFTAFGSVVGTLEYMSPEQAKLNQLDIDTRSDVYALGVLLYELLTGSTPLDRARIASAAFDEVLRLIREEEPARPSTRLSSSRTQPATGGAHARHPVRPTQLGQALRGELDWIVMKALEKDRARRYETANGLARDVQRYLEDEAVEACPPTLGYRLRKAYRRNRAAVAAGSAFVLLLTASVLLATALAVQARRAERRAEDSLAEARASEAEAIAQRQAADRERQRAEEETRSAQAVRDFLQNDLLGQASGWNQGEAIRLGGGDFKVEANPTIRELLDRAAFRLEPGRIDARFPGLPALQAEVLQTVGEAYMMVNEPTKGAELLGRAVALDAASRGHDHPAAFAARHMLAETSYALGRLDEAEQMVDDLIADKVRVLGPHHPDTYQSQILKGTLLFARGRFAEAVDFFGPLAASAGQHLGPDHLYALWAAVNLTEGLALVGRHEEATAQIDRIFRIESFVSLQFDHPAVQSAIATFADVYNRAGRRDDAIRLYRGALAALEADQGPLHPSTWRLRHLLGWVLHRGGDHEGAEAVFRANLPIDTRGHVASMSREALGICLRDSGQLDEALALHREAMDIEVALRGPAHRSWWTGKLRMALGETLLAKHEYGEAEPLLVEARRDLLAHRDQHFYGEDQGDLEKSRLLLRRLYEETGQTDELRRLDDEAARELKAELDRLADDPKAKTFDRASAAADLALALADLGRDDEVIPVFRDAFERTRAEGWPVDQDALGQYSRLRLAVSRAGRHDLAAELAAGVVERLRMRPETPPEVLKTEVFALAHHLLWGGHPEQAEPLLRETLAMQREIDPDSWILAKATFFLGTAMLWREEFDEAEALLLECDELVANRIALAPRWEKNYPAVVAGRLAELYTASKRKEEAAKWRAAQSKRSTGE